MLQQMSVFDMLETEEELDDFHQCIRDHGSGFSGGKVRIYAAAIRLSDKDLAEFMKEEFGTGGFGWKGFNMDYSSKGLHLRVDEKGLDAHYKWIDAAKAAKRLVAGNRYLSEKDRVQVEEIKANHGGVLPMPRARYGFS